MYFKKSPTTLHPLGCLLSYTQITSVGKDAEKSEPSCIAVGNIKWQLLWKIVQQFLKKLNTELPYDPAIPLLNIYLRKMKALTQKDICIPMLIAALLL